jgi:hypothetical protein
MLTVLPFAGCGKKDPFQRHEVSGKVTYRGKDVEYGMLVFEPKESIGKHAPVTYAPVRNGQFKTTKEDGPTTGAYKVRVIGLDRSKLKPDEISEDIPPLFPEHQLTVDIPPPADTLNVDVPAR